jgi:hypothetical protein
MVHRVLVPDRRAPSVIPDDGTARVQTTMALPAPDWHVLTVLGTTARPRRKLDVARQVVRLSLDGRRVVRALR